MVALAGGILAGSAAMVLGATRIPMALAFFGSWPTAAASAALAGCIVWAALGGVIVSATVTAWRVSRATVADWSRWRRAQVAQRAAEVALGGCGFALLGWALHVSMAAAVHAGPLAEAVALVSQR